MKKNHFIYADLSTYDLGISRTFYSNVFGWKYFNSGEDYWIALSKNKEATGLYETPKKFQEMNMPSFWMSYIQVNDILETIELARAKGGIIELIDLDASIGKIALIRDPWGAGFTVYEGDMLNARTVNTPNTLVWNELFVSDVKMVKSFYESIFEWKIKASGNGRFKILDLDGEEISAINEVSKSIKGKFEYWSVFFAVKDIEKTESLVLQNGGSLVYEDSYYKILADSFGAFFHIVQTK